MKWFLSISTAVLGLALLGLCASRVQSAPPSGASNDASPAGAPAKNAGTPIDFPRLRAIHDKLQAGKTLTPEEQDYAQWAFQQMRQRKQGGAGQPGQGPMRNPGRSPGDRRSGPQSVTAPSHLFARGDVEILTFESEEEYDRLQELCRDSQNVQCAPGETVTLYLHSRTDSSVQPYAVRLPNNFSPKQTYPLVVQLHGLNFHEVLSGSRTHYKGMFGGNQWIPIIYICAIHDRSRSTKL